MDLKNVFQIGGVVLGHELIEKTLSSLFDGVKEYGSKYMKSKIFGLGTNDEVLFNSALTYAFYGLGVKEENLVRILSVIDSYPTPSHTRIVEIIGCSEQAVTVDIPDINKKGELIIEKHTFTANVQGARTLEFWSHLSDDEIRLQIRAARINTPIADKIAKVLSTDNLLKGAKAIAETTNTSYKAAKSGFDEIGNDLVKPNAISRLADRFKKR